MKSWAIAWLQREQGVTPPDRLRNVRVMQWQDFQRDVLQCEDYFVETVVGSILYGDAFILKGAFTPEFICGMRENTATWESERESSFHKILDGVPDFHRRIDIETGKKYSILACKHSAYFFRWNDDPLNLWPTITARWRILKLAMGLDKFEYEANKPSMGPTDRIQVVRYPPAIGYLEPHRDAAENQRCFISGYLSKRGVDYQGGGFYFVDDENKARFVEDEIDVGDICIAHANLLHGVAPSDTDKTPSWIAQDGRWFLGLYSNASDYEEKRTTSKPVKIEVEGVRPYEVDTRSSGI